MKLPLPSTARTLRLTLCKAGRDKGIGSRIYFLSSTMIPQRGKSTTKMVTTLMVVAKELLIPLKREHVNLFRLIKLALLRIEIA
jgi:hypothetical protein